MSIKVKPLVWRKETARFNNEKIVNYFADVFCGEYCVSPYEHDMWMATGVISGMKSDRYIGSLADCQIWASGNWCNYILSSIEEPK